MDQLVHIFKQLFWRQTLQMYEQTGTITCTVGPVSVLEVVTCLYSWPNIVFIYLFFFRQVTLTCCHPLTTPMSWIAWKHTTPTLSCFVFAVLSLCFTHALHQSLRSDSFSQIISGHLDKPLRNIWWYNWSTNLKHTTVLTNYWLKWCEKLSIFPCNSSSLTLNDSNLLSVE